MKEKKHVLVWIVIALGLVLIGCVVLALVLHRHRAAPPADTVPQTTTLSPPVENTLTPMDFAYIR